MATYNFTGVNGDPLPIGLTAKSGTQEIKNNTLVASGTIPSGVGSICTQTGNADSTVEATYNANGTLESSTNGIMFRYSDNDNYWSPLVRASDGVVRLFKRVAGTFTVVDTYTIVGFSTTTDYVCKAVFTGSTISILIDGTERLTATDSFNSSATLHGLRYGSANDKSFDDLTVPDAGAAGNSIAITSVVDYQCRQRNGSNQATFTIAGTVSGATTVEYRIDAGAWIELDASPTTTFTGSVTVTNQQDVSVRLSNDTGITSTVLKLTAAACIAAWWQSNESGRGINNQTVTVGGGNPIPIMYKGGVYSALTDPTGIQGSSAGSTWPRIAQQYSDAGIPMCVANVAIGGTAITEWQPAGANYITITDFATAVGGLEFTTSVGGERDTVLGTAQATIEAQLNTTVNALNTAYGTKHYLTYFPGGDGLAGTPSTVWDAFDVVVASNANCLDGGDLRGIDIDIATATGNDGLHLKQDADLDTAGDIRYTKFTLNGSTLDLVINAIPDGSYTVTLDEESGTRLFRGVVAFTDEAASISIPIAQGSTIKGYVDDNSNPSTHGAYIEGITV